jgi:hypothetical protein
VPGGEPQAARRALAAGCDVLLYPAEPEALAAALEGDAAAQTAAGRVQGFLEQALLLAAETDGGGRRDEQAPRRVAERAVLLAADESAGPACDVLVLVDDDGIESRGAVLSREGARRGTAVLSLRVPAEGEAALPELPASVRAVGIVVFASARAWKGASGVSPACRRAVASLKAAVESAGGFQQTWWLTPRAEDPLDEHLPGTGPHLEAALVPRLMRPAPRSRS